MSEEIIKYGINVRECPHINAYNLNKPICQKGVGIGGSPSECNGNCDYVRNADIERLKKENKENLHYLACMTEQRNKLKLALEEIRKIAENYFEECGVPDDYFKRNNYSWKQHQIKGLTCKLQQIFDKSNEVLK